MCFTICVVKSCHHWTLCSCGQLDAVIMSVSGEYASRKFWRKLIFLENLLLRKRIFLLLIILYYLSFETSIYIGEEDKIDCNKSEEETNTMHTYKKYVIHVWQQLCEGVQVEGVEILQITDKCMYSEEELELSKLRSHIDRCCFLRYR